ncbi:VWA domain-containing protein [Halorarum halobium]|uniref:VWA domain-containing protein n=1 Tax=Halorarum halobium TaxID=3075121 RepID=UPI0028AB23AC|nr:VWA domain-containing protein [Halobaculum sp. XH14]
MSEFPDGDGRAGNGSGSDPGDVGPGDPGDVDGRWWDGAGGDVPDFVAARDHVREELVRFVRALRRAGVPAPANAGTTAARALVEVGFDEEATARAALRACLVTDPDDVATFDRLFGEFWRRLDAGLSPEGPAPRREDGPEGALAPMGGEPADSEAESDATAGTNAEEPDGAGWETSVSFGEIAGDDADDAAEIEAAWYSRTGNPTPVAEDRPRGGDVAFGDAFDELAAGLATLRGRRWRGGGGPRADARRALRESFSTGGTVVSVPGRERTLSGVRTLWLVDVSRSVLDTLDRSFLLATLRRASAEWRNTRVFLFDEDCREVTAAFEEPTSADALAALERADAEWGGGTRIGGSIASLHEGMPDAVDHRTNVFIISDGLEMGDVDELERELARLAGRAASVLWLNPLAASPAYEPTARGMAAALPFVDGLFAFGGPDDLAEVGRQVRRHGTGGRIGYEYDPRRGSSVDPPAPRQT